MLKVARDEEHMDVSNLQSQIDEHKTETPNLSTTTNELKTPVCYLTIIMHFFRSCENKIFFF